MKICLLTDTHWGCRNDNQYFYDFQKKFLDNIFFPYLKKEGIEQIVHLGDLVDNRRHINIQTAKRLREDFIEPLENNNIEMDIIVGNHDVYYKNTNVVNALDELGLDTYENIHVFRHHPHEASYGLLVPWISSYNREESLNMIKNSKSKYCFGHFELKGFEIGKGRISNVGLDITNGIFNNFTNVFSGHYHTRSRNSNICYIGSCFPFTWADYGDYRGFAVLDTETEKIKFIKNPYNIFSRIEYDEDNLIAFDRSIIENTYCRVKVIKKESQSNFNDFISKIQDIGVIDLIIDDFPVKIDISETAGETDNTIDFFRRAIDDIEFENKNSVKELTEKIYQEALEV